MEITVTNRQNAIRVDVSKLEELALAAFPLCLGKPARSAAPLSSLGSIEVTVLSNAAIAGVHQEFMHIGGPTDVITFDHGEILIGAGVARENARRFGVDLDREMALYIIHGLLHLNGYEDAAPDDAARMRVVQEEILEAVFAEPVSPAPQTL